MAKRGQNEGSIRQRKDGSWEARVTTGIDTKSGKQQRKSLYGKTRKEVAAKMTDILNELQKGTLTDVTSITVAQWLNEWMREYKKLQLKNTTYINYSSLINNQIIPVLGKCKLSDLRVNTVQSFVNELTRKGLSPESVYSVVKVLKCAVKQAFINGMISKNVTYGIIMPKSEPSPRKAFTLEQQNDFVKIANGVSYGDVFVLNLFTGMRIGELLALRWTDISLDEKYLQVNRTITVVKDLDDPESKWHKEFGTPKTPSSRRTIPLKTAAIKLLRKVKSKQAELRFKLGAGYENNDLVFCTDLGKPLDPRNMQRIFHSICDKLDLQGFSIHCLRHTFATLGYAQGMDLKVLQEILGHASISETANTYTHIDINTKRQAMEKTITPASFM